MFESFIDDEIDLLQYFYLLLFFLPNAFLFELVFKLAFVSSEDTTHFIILLFLIKRSLRLKIWRVIFFINGHIGLFSWLVKHSFFFKKL